ncbi:MAG: TylF/MycF family methyltransferase [Micavibrio sp.]|nr:TylF/MycF family methyltransferase [Micavibrio sp.]
MINKQTVKRTVRNTLRQVGVNVSQYKPRGQERFPQHFDDAFGEIYRRNCHNTMVPSSALHAAYQAAKYVAQNNVPGDLVECGVWKGGCVVMMAETLAYYGDTSRKVYLYDTFAGMTEPTEEDRDYIRGYDAIDRFNKSKKDTHTDWAYAPFEEVERNVEASTYPSKQFVYVKGKVEETIPGTLPDAIALLRVDTDWYESTKHEMEHLYPLISKGGVFICDDYGSWAGSRKAVDEYFEKTKANIFMQYDAGSSAITGVKME